MIDLTRQQPLDAGQDVSNLARIQAMPEAVEVDSESLNDRLDLLRRRAAISIMPAA